MRSLSIPQKSRGCCEGACKQELLRDGKVGKGLPRWHPLCKEHACQCRRRKRCGSIPGLGRSLEEGRATHSSILAWRIPWTEEPGGLLSIGVHRFGHDWSCLTCTQSRGKSATQVGFVFGRCVYVIALERYESIPNSIHLTRTLERKMWWCAYEWESSFLRKHKGLSWQSCA